MPQVHEYLRMLFLREQVDNSIQRFRRIIRVHGSENEVTRAGHVQRRAHGLGITNLTDQNNVGRGSNGTLECAVIRLCIQSDLALIDD